MKKNIKADKDALENNTLLIRKTDDSRIILDNDTGDKNNNQGKNIDSNPSKSSKKKVKKYLFAIFEFFKIIIIALIIVLPIRYFLFQPFIVKGESMVPNFQSGDYLIVDEISYKIGSPQRGNVIVFKYPLDNSQRFIKRIIGLPGETVEIKDGTITVSKDGVNVTLNESKYLSELKGTEGNVRLALSDNEYFVLGDNRQFSYDSRRWGALPKQDIIGRVIFRVFPISTMSYILKPSY